MPEEKECCSTGSCGCSLTVYSTTKECPTCGKRLRLTGRSQLAEFRFNCPTCGYQSPLLSQLELQEVL